MAKGHKDKVAVITGAAGGIGQAFAKRLAEDGVHIAVADLGDGGETVKMVQAAGRDAIAVKCDVSSEDSVAAMAKQVQSKFSHVDIVVNCAGIFPQKNFPDMAFADWRKVHVDQSRRHLSGHRRLRPRHAGSANGAAWSTWRRRRSARWLPALPITSPARAASSASPARSPPISPATASPSTPSRRG